MGQVCREKKNGLLQLTSTFKLTTYYSHVCILWKFKGEKMILTSFLHLQLSFGLLQNRLDSLI